MYISCRNSAVKLKRVVKNCSLSAGFSWQQRDLFNGNVHFWGDAVGGRAAAIPGGTNWGRVRQETLYDFALWHCENFCWRFGPRAGVRGLEGHF